MSLPNVEGRLELSMFVDGDSEAKGRDGVFKSFTERVRGTKGKTKLSLFTISQCDVSFVD